MDGQNVRVHSTIGKGVQVGNVQSLEAVVHRDIVGKGGKVSNHIILLWCVDPPRSIDIILYRKYL
jgi:hypothetical protein